MASHLSGYNPRKNKKTTREKDIEEEGTGGSVGRQEQGEASDLAGSSGEQRTMGLTGEGSGQEMSQQNYSRNCKEFGVAVIVRNDRREVRAAIRTQD